MIRRLTVTVLAFFAITLLCNIPLQAAQTPPQKTPELLEKGKKLYQQQKCASCHGPQGNAQTPMSKILKPPPRDFTLPLKDWAVSKGEPARIFSVIQQGIPNTAMVKFNLPQEDIWALVYTVMEFAGVK